MAEARGMTDYTWPEGKQSAFCFTIDLDAHAPWLWATRNETPDRLGQIELRRFGLRQGMKRILSLLERFEIPATVFVPAVIAEDHPDVLPGLVEAGHEVALHGYFHEIVADVSDAEFTEALERSIALFVRQTGERPKGFRSPAWEMTRHMLAEVKRHGFYDSSLMGFDHPYTIDGVTELPVQWTTDDAIYFKFYGGGLDGWAPSPPGPVGDGWYDEWRVLDREGQMFMLTIHDWISGRAQRIAMLERLLERVRAEGDPWFATAGEIAAHHQRAHAGDFVIDAAHPPAISARTKSLI